MSVSSVAASNAGLPGASASDSALSSLANDYTTFINLLVAQVKYQDPLEPMESTEFVSQIAQLTQVEQSVLSNQHMEALRSQLAMSGALSETALIGRDVTVPTDQFVLSDGVGRFAFELESSATELTATIRDSAGRPVRQIALGAVEGGALTDVAWDGRDAAGNVLADGNYTITLSVGTGSAGAYSTYASGTVLGVDYSNGETILRLTGGRTASAGDVIRAS